ncbi:putative arylalkylamine n-acetyltransferase, partial [Operophtera brumata]
PDLFTVKQVKNEEHKDAVDIIKKHYMVEHVLVKTRKMDLSSDRALDEYLLNVLKQGNSLFAKTDDGSIAGLCVSFASSPVDPRNLRNYAFYRQIKMLTVLPEYRRQGLATMLVEKSKEQALDQGYKVIRMDCINPYE